MNIERDPFYASKLSDNLSQKKKKNYQIIYLFMMSCINYLFVEGLWSS